MIKIALAHNHYDAEHLVSVMADMQKMGAPTVRIVQVDGDLYQAIEGCHRLRAAAALGITPEFDAIDEDTLIVDVDGLDWEGSGDGELTVGSIGDWENCTLIFDD